MSRQAEQLLFESLIPLAKKYGQTEKLTEIHVAGKSLPMWSIQIGPEDKTLPCIGLFAGVHGLERVGSHVVLHYLKSLLQQMEWDASLRDLFKQVRLVSIPMINPGGLYLSTRSNPQGVDIMRNAPIEGDEPGYRLVSGQKISPKIPWFRGNPDDMEVETKTLIDYVQREMFPSQFSMALDVHSGFGMRDRLWYPYSHSRRPYHHLDVVLNFEKLLTKTQPYHVYKLEPQTDSYLIHGDPWDYLCRLHEEQSQSAQVFLPWCLEMGSWTWLKKNPAQIFSKSGLFNPILPHRYGRIMRRHRTLFDIFIRATMNFTAWKNSSQQEAAPLGAGLQT